MNSFIYQLWHQHELRYFCSPSSNSTYIFLTLRHSLCSNKASLGNQKLATVTSGKIQFEEKSLAKDKRYEIAGGPVNSSSPERAY